MHVKRLNFIPSWEGLGAFKGMFFIISHLGVGSVGSRHRSVGRESAFFCIKKHNLLEILS